MNKLISFLALIVALSTSMSARSEGASADSRITSVNFSERLSPDFFSQNSDSFLVRAQNPTFDEGLGSPYFGDGTAPMEGGIPNQQFAQPIVPAQPIMPGQPVDPFLNPQANMMGPFGPPQQFGVQAFPGVNGPQPYRFGWTLRTEFEYLSDENVTLNGSQAGSAEVFGLNVEAQNAKPLGPGGWVFINTPNFMWRNVNGVPAPLDVDNLFQFGWDFKLVSPSVGGWGMELAFEPSINSDLKGGLDGSKGTNLDARGALMWQWGPQLTWIGGIFYLERVEDRILPYGGAVWRPNQLWEFRIMYPESQAKLFMGNYWGWSHWLYARFDFLHSEAYQIEPISGFQTQLQVEDIRATIGWQFDTGAKAGFLEAGWIFDRDIVVGSPLPLTGTIDDGFIARAGIRF